MPVLVSSSKKKNDSDNASADSLSNTVLISSGSKHIVSNMALPANNSWQTMHTCCMMHTTHNAQK